jgi:cytochrome c6
MALEWIARRFFDLEKIMRERMGWIGRIILAGAVLAGIGFLNTSARADEKSAALYKQKCAGCHGAAGKGDTASGKALKVKDFASEEVRKMSDEDLSEAIRDGKGKMPAYAKSLKPDEIKAMVAYVRSLAK